MTPDHLTAVAIGGALVAGLALVGCRVSGWFVPLVCLGLIANWFGDSLDGALARNRHIERHRVGFLIDHTADVVSLAVIILALGLSPYLTLDAALMLLVAYLVHAVYALMRTVVDGVQIIGMGGIGATEGRIFIGVWVATIQIGRLSFASFPTSNIDVFNMAAAALLVVWFAVFVRRVALDVSRIGSLEQAARPLHRASQGYDNALLIVQGDKTSFASPSKGTLEHA